MPIFGPCDVLCHGDRGIFRQGIFSYGEVLCMVLCCGCVRVYVAGMGADCGVCHISRYLDSYGGVASLV